MSSPLPNIIKGDSWGYVLTLTNASGTAFNYTGSTLTAELLDKAGGKTVAVFSVANLGSGLLKVYITPSQTAGLSVQDYYHKATLVQPDGWTTRMVDSVVHVKP
jgi:hypothetical protein